MEAAEEIGIPRDVSDIVLPLGATMRMDGSVFSAILKISFLFGFFGMPFDGIGTYVTALMIAIFSGIAMSGVAGGGFVGEMVIVSLFFPEQMGIAFPVIATIGALVDPPADLHKCLRRHRGLHDSCPLRRGQGLVPEEAGRKG